MSRDMVVCNIDGTPYLFAVKTAGKSFKSTVSPDKDTNNWEKSSSPYSMLFANFVYTDNASVGGFVFSDEQMRSTSTTDENSPNTTGSNCNILLDGSTGKFVANHATIRGTIYAKSGSFTGEVNANSGTFSNCTINETCKAGFMKYAANKLNSNVINCGLVNLIDAYNKYSVTAFYLPSVGNGEFMRITILNVVLTKITIPDFTLSIYGSGVFNDFYNFPPGDNTYTTPITISRGDYYEFLGMNDGNGTRWICTNRALPRI